MRTLDVSDLPAFAFHYRSVLGWGILCGVAIEATMFGLLMATYFYLRLGVDVWPPPGVAFPGLLVPTASLAFLLLSALPAKWSTDAAIANDTRGIIRYLIYNVILSTASLVLRVVEWHSFNFAWHSSSYGSIVWLTFGLHTLDFGIGLIYSIVLIAIGLAGKIGDRQRVGVDGDSMGWFLVVASWVPLYLTVYIAPYFLRAGR